MFDVIVVGGGHAGVEAVYTAAKMGMSVLLISLDKNKIASMPCNPSIGGLGKGHIVYEVSALGGLMPKLCSKTYLQARLLNTRKGPAVQGLRLQIDKSEYSKLALETLGSMPGVTIEQAAVTEVLTEKGCKNHKKVVGVCCSDSKKFFAKSVVITAGTFLDDTIYIGQEKKPRDIQESRKTSMLTASLESELGVKFGRLKTGTPPRLLTSSINFEELEHQEAHSLKYLFEFNSQPTEEKQQCFIAYTNEKTNEIIQKNIKESALFSGKIEGIGPRYCPSIEDKVNRYPDRTRHHVFIEPEDSQGKESYPAGLSTSLPLEVQQKYINSIQGLENAIITKPGYAIEYDFLQPNNLTPFLETKTVEGLFFAGQINGTTGYEEAAGQGIVAGINAVLKIQGKEPFVLDRTEAYIGVMIDDIITLGVDEPYRMFTSRAERRLLLRQDNCFARLTSKAREFGLIDETFYKDFCCEQFEMEKMLAIVSAQRPNGSLFKVFNDIEFGSKVVKSNFKSLEEFNSLSQRSLLSIHAEIRYYGYIEKERKEAEKLRQQSKLRIPEDLIFKDIPGLTRELQEKLSFHRPQTISQSFLIPGMTPAAAAILIFQIKILENHSG
jgi:tRNA uridine 5-carboxymethylaminomethyl modification enzyme